MQRLVLKMPMLPYGVPKPDCVCRGKENELCKSNHTACHEKHKLYSWYDRAQYFEKKGGG